VTGREPHDSLREGAATAAGGAAARAGTVYFVAAGPGQPELLTCRGARLLTTADVVVIGTDLGEIPSAIPENTVVLDRHADEDRTASSLIERARAGSSAVHLSVRGPGSGLLARIIGAGVPCEVVPGVDSALAAATFAGVPLSTRSAAARAIALDGLPAELARALEEPLAARPATETCLLVEEAGSPFQRVSAMELGSVRGALAALVPSRRAALVLGDRVTADRARWLEARPLHGRTVALLRARAQTARLKAELRALGASVQEHSVIAFLPPLDPEPLERAARDLSSFDWVVFTSPNGADAVLETLRRSRRDARAFGRARVAVIGEGTAAPLRKAGIEPDLVARDAIGEGLLEDLVRSGVREKRVLLPRADIARPALAEGLAKAGARVEPVVAYRTVPSEDDLAPLREGLARGAIDAVLFTSSSTALYLEKKLGKGELARAFLGAKTIAASMGPVTSASLRELGLEPGVEAKDHTMNGLVRALCERFSASRAT
jgi:uroporphyrinogen III methyltransferase/synthase